MTDSDFESKISKTIQELSNPASYEMVCHQHKRGEPLPSIANLTRIINLIREILFPGYFGNTSLRTNTTQHYMGVHVDELFELDAVSHEMQRHRMSIGVFYQYLLSVYYYLPAF